MPSTSHTHVHAYTQHIHKMLFRFRNFRVGAYFALNPERTGLFHRDLPHCLTLCVDSFTKMKALYKMLLTAGVLMMPDATMRGCLF